MKGAMQQMPMRATKTDSSILHPRVGLLQRKCACGGSSGVGAECAESQEEQRSLQRRPVNGAEPTTVPPIVHEVLQSPGQPLDSDTRAFMEPRFGHDFSQVRVHTDAKASESARAVNALAYTVGRDMILGARQYAPKTGEGRRLLAHELAHTIQQGHSGAFGVRIENSMSENTLNDKCEHQADVQARKVISEVNTESIIDQEHHQAPRIQCKDDPSAQSSPLVGDHVLIQPTLQKQDDPIDVDLVPATLEEQRRAEELGINLPEVSEETWQAIGGASSESTVVYICSKALDTSPVGSHAFFRIGGSGTGNPTISLQPIDTTGTDCWQGVPDRDYPSDRDAEADCELTAISLSCLESEFRAYPIGHYCTLGPNSNTFVGHVAKNCGISSVDPSGWTPGIDDSPPPHGTFAPDKWATLLGCETKMCLVDGISIPDNVA